MMFLIAVVVPHYIIGIALGAGIFGFFMLGQGVLLIKGASHSNLTCEFSL